MHRSRLLFQIVLITLGISALAVSPASAVSVLRGYAVTENTYSGGADWNAAVKSEFGPDAEVADWNDIVAEFGGTSQEARDFCDLVLLGSSASVTRNGSKKYGSWRYYFASAHYGNKPSNYLAHSQIQGNMISLGSWSGNRRIVARNVTLAPHIPEPATLLAGLAGIAGVGGYLRRRGLTAGDAG